MGTAIATEIDRAPASGGGTFVRSLPVVTLAHLPPLPGDPGRSRLVFGGYAAPWPGSLQLTDVARGTKVAELPRRATLGATATGLLAGPVAVWDRSQSLEVTVHAGHLASVEPEVVLAGGNRLAVEGDDGRWEVIGFAEAALVSVGRYRLTGLLRGLEGTASTTAAVGRRVMLLDGRCVTLAVEAHLLGEARSFRVYAGSSDLEGTLATATTSADAARPLSPVHLRASRSSGGAIGFNWVRRSRADGDGWGAGESPLEHVPERYALKVFNGTTLVRAFDSLFASASYGSAEQVADFGALPGSFIFTVAQVSPVLGEGHAAEGQFNG